MASTVDMPTVPTASAADTLQAVAKVVTPVVARGAIVRRPRVVDLADRMEADARAVSEMRRLRDRYGPGPVQVSVAGRRFAILLEPGDVHRVLEETPVPFAADTREKRGALGHFQPEGLLVSSPDERRYRRPFNEAVLDTGQPVHRFAETVSQAVAEETGALLGHVRFSGSLGWDEFALAWWRIVRRVVLGAGARDDEDVTDQLLRLRRDANWSYLRPKRRSLQRSFLDSIQRYVDRAEPGSLAELVASTPAPEGTAREQQVPQWLFAFDAGAWTSFRGLALLLAHPEAGQRARSEAGGGPDRPFLRSVLLEALRLWPTTPAILRDTTEDTTWRGAVLPAGASVLIFAPFFHRDETRVPQAHRFSPELWQADRGTDDWPLVPFSGGPAMCPGRNLVLLVMSMVVGELLPHLSGQVAGTQLDRSRPLPSTLTPFALRFGT